MQIADFEFIPDVLLRLEAMAEETGWDTPASLYALHAENLGEEMTAVGVADFPGFDLAMHLTGYSYHATRAVTAALRGSAGDGRRPDLSGLFGVVLVDEAWVVAQVHGQPHPTGSLADHPDRVEQRFVWLLAADGSSKVLVRQRGGDPEWIGPWKDGRLVDAVRDLLAAALHG